MLSFLPHWLRGTLTLALIAANTLFWFGPVLLLAFAKLLIPLSAWRKGCTVLLIQIASLWIDFNNALLKGLHRIEWDVEGADDLNPRDWYLVTCNHQSWADILVVQKLFNRKIPMLKFFLKQELIWVPFIGVAWWALDFPFMKRYSAEQVAKNPALKGKDLETTRQACEKFKTTPVTVFNFMEGTRLTPEKQQRQGSPYTHLLKPKAGGAAFVLGAMGEQLHTLLNVTIHYPGDDLDFWHFLCGRVRQVVVRIEKLAIPQHFLSRDYLNDESFRQEFQQWVSQLWQEKDTLLAKLHQQYPAARQTLSSQA